MDKVISRHKWIKDEDGKRCAVCGSRINSRIGVKYLERDSWGVIEAVNWYPRCFPLKQIT